MNTFRFPLSIPCINVKDADRVKTSILSGWLTQNGSEVKKMEESLSDFLNGSNSDFIATSASNGTTALHLALLSLGISEGDEVIISDYSYIAVINSILYCRARPVIVDCNLNDWSISIADLKQAITNKTKAVIVVDNYGIQVDLAKIKDLLPDNVHLILDAAESFPGEIGERSWDLADLITFSFYGNKVITTGEGGAIFGKREFIEIVEVLKNQAVDSARTFSHSQIGFNYRMTNYSAALFNSQWERRREIIDNRRHIFNRYHEKFEESGLGFSDNFRANPWLYTISIPEISLIRDKVRESLHSHSIETRPGFRPFSRHPHLAQYISSNSSYQTAQFLSDSTISLPTYCGLKNDQIDEIVITLLNSISK